MVLNIALMRSLQPARRLYKQPAATMEKNSTILEITGSVMQHGFIRKNIQVSDYAFIWSWRAGVLQSLAPTRDV